MDDVMDSTLMYTNKGNARARLNFIRLPLLFSLSDLTKIIRA